MAIKVLGRTSRSSKRNVSTNLVSGKSSQFSRSGYFPTIPGPASPITMVANYILVAGGGGSACSDNGSGAAGGGGGGGLINSTLTLSTANSYIIQIGAGGTGGQFTAVVNPTQGSPSILSSTELNLIAIGGGYGAGSVSPTFTGGDGGSGGGGFRNAAGGANTVGQGYAGGNPAGVYGGAGTKVGGGGGGGAGAVGTFTSNQTAGGTGGIGLNTNISGLGPNISYAGGGGGGAASTSAGGTGGTGGGGNGAANNTSGTAGTINTGGGAGGPGQGIASGVNGVSGGSGIFIISYPGPYQYFDGGTITIANSYVSHTFTSTGTLTAKSPPVLLTSAKTVLVNYLMIGQGGQGGGGYAPNSTGGGGGGAGGFVLETKYFNYASSYLLTFNTGGLSGAPASGQKGGSTILEDLNTTYPMFPQQIADGGGRGIWQAGDGSGTGGSGGGAWTGGGSDALQPTSDTGGFGNSGARSGGGGAGGAAPGGATGTGGVGKISNITGTDVYYAGGGKGGHAGSAGLGSIGQGGAGSGVPGAGSTAGGAGAAGTIILSYPAPQRFSGGTVTTLGANILHTFTSTATLVGLDN